jgi:hypothetical protein
MKAQIAMQFLVIISIVFAMFVVFVVGFAERYNDILTDRERLALKDVALKVHDEIMIAHNLRDGYQREFTLPDLVEGDNYTIYITPNSNIVVVSGDNLEYSTQVAPVQGQLTKGLNLIRKSGGVVWLN